jgi:hypothetical protein
MSVGKEEWEMTLLNKIFLLALFSLWLVAIFYIGSLNWAGRRCSEKKSPLTTVSPFNPATREIVSGR